MSRVRISPGLTLYFAHPPNSLGFTDHFTTSTALLENFVFVTQLLLWTCLYLESACFSFFWLV